MDKKYSVLVVDDQENWRSLLGELLSDEFDVDYADAYESAIESVLEKSPPYHLVVTDIRLVDAEKGNEDGIRLLTTLDKYQQYTKTIVITGYPSIDTAKKALSGLSAYDYIEKVPANGMAFDEKEFRRIAMDAASNANSERPGSFTHLDWNVLIIEPDALWRKELGDLLRKDNYRVDELVSMESLARTLQSKSNPYGLVLARDHLISGSETFYSTVQKYHPEAKVVILTEQNIGDVLRKIHEGSVYSVITLQDKESFKNTFRELVKGAYLPGRTKFVVANLENTPEEGCPRGEKCFLKLEIVDKWAPGSTPISFSPQPGKAGKMHLKVFTYAPGCRLISESERFWVFTKSNHNQNFIIEFIPLSSGDIKIAIDIDQDNRWLGRIEKTIIVI